MSEHTTFDSNMLQLDSVYWPGLLTACQIPHIIVLNTLTKKKGSAEKDKGGAAFLRFHLLVVQDMQNY